jgi:tetratricopeptide (TPR) repeat protein
MAQSHFQQRSFKEAYTVLSNGFSNAGPLEDEFVFWMAECRMSQDNLEAAAQYYRKLLREYPESNRKAESVVALANVLARQNDWIKVVDTLRVANEPLSEPGTLDTRNEVALEAIFLLGQALLEQRDLSASCSTLDLLPNGLLPNQNWRRLLLRAKIAAERGEVDQALLMGDQLRTIAEQEGWSEELVSSYQLRAKLYERKLEWGKAAREYVHLFNGRLSPAIRHHAFLNVVRLRVKGGDFSGANSTLREIRQQKTLELLHPIADYLTGEIYLLMHLSGEEAWLSLAMEHFEKIKLQARNEPLRAHALWGLARCQSLDGKVMRAIESMQNCLEVAKSKNLRAWVQYNLALEYSRQGMHGAANLMFRNVRTNVVNVTAKELMNAALLMQFKSTLADHNDSGAEILLGDIREQSGVSHLGEALLLMVQEKIDRGERGAAGKIFVEIRRGGASSNLLAAADLEEIRLMVIDRKWTKVITAYDIWLKKYPRHQSRPEVLFDRAWALAQSGQTEGAVKSFNELINISPNIRQAFMAKMWLADRVYNSNNNQLTAEKLYKDIYGATNCPPSIRYRAGMMAGRAAIKRQGFSDARNTFKSLIDDEKVKAKSPQIHTDAFFALGDLTIMELGQEAQGQIKKLTQATNAFDRIIQESPTNAVAARAWGRIGDCCLRVSGEQPAYLKHAQMAYEKALAITEPIPVNIRSQSRIGLAYALERQASGEDREKILQESVDHLLAVYFGRDLKVAEKQDPYWRAQSGLIALRLLEQLGSYDEALKICDDMEGNFSGMQPGLRVRKERLRQLKDKNP